MTIPESAFLPYGRQSIDQLDIDAVVAVLRSDRLTMGPAVDAFETAFAAAVGADFAVSCSSGTAALHLAAMAVGLGPGDRAVVPAITFLATANAFRYVGADVVFADVDPNSGLMTADTVEAAVAALDAATRATVRAIAPVHLAGQPCDMPALRALADDRGWAVVEDACHALGSRHADGRPVGGAYGDLATFSFHPVKTIAAGEGGMITTGDPAFAERLRRARSHGMKSTPEDGPWCYEMREPGFNYRLTDIHAALGRSQLAKLDRFVAARKALHDLYSARLADMAPLVRPLAETPAERVGWHLQVVLIDFEAAGLDRATVMRRLTERGIGTQVHYIPVAWQPYYRDLYGRADLPGAARYYARALSLPLHVSMTEADVDRVVAGLAEALGR